MPFTKDVNIAVDVLKKGGVIAFPTDTVYGIGCNIFDLNATNKVFELKRRDYSKPLTAHLWSIDQVETVAQTDSPFLPMLISNFIPGPITIILPKKEIIPDIVTSGKNTIGIRIPDCNIYLELAKNFGLPIATTSANISNQPSAKNAEQVFEYFGDSLDVILDGGETKYRLESTIVDISQNIPKILRIGVISKEQIEQALGLILNE